MLESSSLKTSATPCTFRELVEKAKTRFSALSNSDLALRFKFSPVDKRVTHSIGAMAQIEVDD